MDVTMISHESALLLMRELRCLRRRLYGANVKEVLVTTRHAGEARDFFADACPSQAGRPVHLLVFDRSRRCRVAGTKVHYDSHGLLEGGAVHLAPGLVMSSPEQLFVQMAGRLSYEQLFLLGLELCGTFSISLSREAGFECDLVPATTPERIRSFAVGTPFVRNASELRDVAARLEANSASPQESRAFIKLSASRRRGGYDVHDIIFNHVIRLSDDAATLAGQRTCRVDLAHVEAHLAVEYDSAAFHADAKRSQRDKRRRDALCLDGWTVKTLVPAAMEDVAVFDVFARDVLTCVGRLARIRVKDFDEKRECLFRALRDSARIDALSGERLPAE